MARACGPGRPARRRCAGTLWGSEMRFGVPCGQLGSYVVLVGESAEDLFPVDPVLGEVDRLGRAGRCLSWGQLAEGAMRPGPVVVGAENLCHQAIFVDHASSAVAPPDAEVV